jgi:hypothetical protein
MIVKSWYWIILGIWIFTGLPILIIGIAFGGESLLTARGLSGVFLPPLSRFDLFLEWIFDTILIFGPLLVLPWAIRKRHRSEPPMRLS